MVVGLTLTLTFRSGNRNRRAIRLAGFLLQRECAHTVLHKDNGISFSVQGNSQRLRITICVRLLRKCVRAVGATRMMPGAFFKESSR
jgi:hypothetical protein